MVVLPGRRFQEYSTQKDAQMAKFIAVHAVSNVATWKSFDAERATVFAPFASDLVSYVDPAGGKTVALSFTLNDAAGLKAFMQTPAAGAAMERHGVIQPVTFLSA